MTTGGKFTFADMQNPLFLHPSDGPLSVSVAKLQGAGDYRSWRRSFEIQLSSKRKLGFLTGTVQRDTTDDVQATQWDTCNNLVISWLHANVSDTIRKSILFISSACEIWRQLERRFQLSNGSRKYKLNKDLFSLTQNKLSVNDYFTQLCSLWEELESMNILPSLTTVTPDITILLTAINTQREESKLFVFLNGLDEVCSPIRSQLLMQHPLPTVEMACAVIQQEESQRSVLSLSEIEASAMYTKRVFDSKPAQCTACGGKGHLSDKCWSVVGYPPWHLKHKKFPQKGSGSPSGNQMQIKRPGGTKFGSKMANNVSQSSGDSTTESDIVFSPQQLEQILKLIPGSSLQTLKGSNSECEEDFDFSFSGMVTCNLASTTSNTWIIDSGASDHITGTVELLTNVRPAGQHLTIKLPTGAMSTITQIGDITLSNGLLLSYVLVVPQFQHNLLSIHKLSKDNACEIQFSPEVCQIVNSNSKEVQAEGKMCNGLYYLVDQPALDRKLCNNAVVDYNTWHLRLGHAAQSKMNLIAHLKGHGAKTDQVCLTCPMAKFQKLPFSDCTSHSSANFALIHLDTWGPYKVHTRGKFKYFLTIVDDRSRNTWLYLMKNKSDFFVCFQAFYEYVFTKFKTKIECIRSDNAPEFSDSACTAFYASRGIIHQKSCVNRPQQNARVERKHKHILEVARALKFQSGLPVSYWGDFVMTAVFIINRLPTPLLKNKSPFEVLYDKPVDYDELRTFGCLVMAPNHTHNVDKLIARAVPCVFIGYPPGQKGYKLIDLSNMQTFVSRDTLFYESIFPLNESSVKSYAQPVPCDVPQIIQNPVAVTSEDDIVIDNNDDSQTPLRSSNDTLPSSPIVAVPRRKSTRATKPPVWLESYVHTLHQPNANVLQVTDQAVLPQFHCFLASLTKAQDPVSFKQAVQQKHWVDAMNVELNALEENNTWEITTLPPQKKAIACKWVYKTKFNPDGSVERFKARLVILGCRQTYGVDYLDTFAPVAKLTTVRTLLAVAAVHDWIVIQMDVTNAFLHGDLHESVYMKPPPGYQGTGSRIKWEKGIISENSAVSFVCKLLKSLYGLKQAPRLWFTKLSLKLLELGYTQSKTDYSLFTLTSQSSITLVLVYVDDLLIAGNSTKDIDSLKSFLSTSFHMKDLGAVNYFLGLEVHRSSNGFFISLEKICLGSLSRIWSAKFKDS